ncbi:Serine protease snake [Melipona quadrifasciata]|uniref:Serine protease snake n=1 Tax=Melipona quadrifasciata TaxID=166423 RepID=A0A0M9AB69_9HYME|nr:Serine protease snake [Melipona quadrifasciata]
MNEVRRQDRSSEGMQCELESGDMGICKKLPECTPRLKEVREGRRQLDSSGRCGFSGFVEIVCCPINSNTEKISPRLADTACQTYLDAQRNRLSFHIYGGTEAKSGEFPYVVALGYEDKNDLKTLSSISYSCGGSLISVDHVLTAAHCVSNIYEKVPIEVGIVKCDNINIRTIKVVRLGNESIDSNATNVQRIPISDIISHPKYKRSASYNDVAILKLKTKVLLSSMVQPVCLQTQSLNPLTMTPKMSLIVIGWGGIDFGESSSSKLMKTPNLSIVDKEECAKYYTGFPKLPLGITDNMICVVDPNRTRGADACQGDSGGPLLLLTEEDVKVIGITAFGQGCAGVYTMVYSYLDWIEEQVWTSNKESKDILKTEFINPILNITITRQASYPYSLEYPDAKKHTSTKIQSDSK